MPKKFCRKKKFAEKKICRKFFAEKKILQKKISQKIIFAKKNSLKKILPPKFSPKKFAKKKNQQKKCLQNKKFAKFFFEIFLSGFKIMVDLIFLGFHFLINLLNNILQLSNLFFECKSYATMIQEQIKGF